MLKGKLYTRLLHSQEKQSGYENYLINVWRKKIGLCLFFVQSTSHMRNFEGVESILTWNGKSNQANLWIILNIRKLAEHLQGRL